MAEQRNWSIRELVFAEFSRASVLLFGTLYCCRGGMSSQSLKRWLTITFSEWHLVQSGAYRWNMMGELVRLVWLIYNLVIIISLFLNSRPEEINKVATGLIWQNLLWFWFTKKINGISLSACSKFLGPIVRRQFELKWMMQGLTEYFEW